MNARHLLAASFATLALPLAAQDGSPQRLPDGSVFVPKGAQRQLEVRTAAPKAGEFPRVVEMAGKVTLDPNAGGRVQALLAGRLEPGPKGLPGLGQSVRKGEVLAWVVPSAGQLDVAAASAQVAEMKAARSLAGKRLARLRALQDTVPRKEIESAEVEVASLDGRLAAIGAGLGRRDALVAPATGVIASAHAVAGQVVDARELVFEIVDPARLRVEALAYDGAAALDVENASLAVGGASVPLEFLGAGGAMREQALPLVFRAQSEMRLGLAVGQPVKVYVRTRARVKGLEVPAVALARNPSNQLIVWVKTAPERFEPKTVLVQPLDGIRVAVVGGLAEGDRVVVRGASLVNQVR